MEGEIAFYESALCKIDGAVLQRFVLSRQKAGSVCGLYDKIRHTRQLAREELEVEVEDLPG